MTNIPQSLKDYNDKFDQLKSSLDILNKQNNEYSKSLNKFNKNYIEFQNNKNQWKGEELKNKTETVMDQLYDVKERNKLNIQNLKEFSDNLKQIQEDVQILMNIYLDDEQDYQLKLEELSIIVKRELESNKKEKLKLIEEKMKNLEKEKMEIEKEFEILSKPLKEYLPDERYNLNIQQKKQLEEWTSLKCGNIVFDSNIDDWSENTSVFNEKIIGRKQLTILIEDEEGEKFGYYLNTQVVEEYEAKQETNFKTFKFNFQSKNNRLLGPMKYEIKELKYGGIVLFEKSKKFLIRSGNIFLFKENNKNKSYYFIDVYFFDYHGIKNALCGKEANKDGLIFFTPKRILVIQMK